MPAGTRNHFALDLGLDRDDVAAALDAYGDAHERRIDLALIGERIFVNNASLGAYARVVQSPAYRDAKLATTADVLPDLLGPEAERSDLRFTRPDGEVVASADILLVSNGAYRLGSLNGFGTRERMDAGVLGVVSVTVDRARDVPSLLAAEATGHIERFRGYREWTAPEFQVDSAEPLLDVGVDGEALRLPPPLQFRSLPGALRVRTPVSVAGASPRRWRRRGSAGRSPRCSGCSPGSSRHTDRHGAARAAVARAVPVVEPVGELLGLGERLPQLGLLLVRQVGRDQRGARST